MAKSKTTTRKGTDKKTGARSSKKNPNRTTKTQPRTASNQGNARSGRKTSSSKRKAIVPKPVPLPPKPEPKKEPVLQPQPTEEKIAIKLDQSVAILVDGNNIEMSLHTVSGKSSSMINFDKLVPALLQNRALSRLIYFREGKSISNKLAERLQKMFHGSVVPCYKSADIPLSIKAVQVASKVDTVIILSGDADYVELVRHLKHDGIRVEIAAFPETTAEILRNESDYFFPITVEYSFALK